MEYFEKTKIISLRADETQLLVSLIKPHKAVKFCSIAKWLKKKSWHCQELMSQSSNPTLLEVQVLTTEQIISKGNWKSCKTFRKFYNRPVVDDENDKFQECVMKL
jgi:hypothetical protein